MLPNEDIEMSVADIDEAIEEGEDTLSALMQQIGHMINESSKISHTIGRYMELRLHKLDLEESDGSMKH